MPIDLQNLPGTGFNAEHRVYSNYFSDNYIIQNVSIVQPKNLLIDILRQNFARDNIYTYRADEFGFPLTPDLTGSSIDSEDTTKVLISDVYRYEVKFFPAITTHTGSGSYKPISFNQNATYKYRKDIVESEFGSVKEIRTPTHRIYAGAWDMSFTIQISSESHSELEELTEIVKMILMHSSWQELRANGLFIKGLSVSGESTEPYSNDYIYTHDITIDTYSEWRVEIPIDNIVEKIVFYFDMVRTPIPNVSTPADVQELEFADIIEIASISL